jgi:hypothetical protein
MSTGAGDSITASLVLLDNPGNPVPIQFSGIGAITQNVNGQSKVLNWTPQWPYPTIIMPGQVLGVWVEAVTVAVSRTISGVLNYVEVNA